MRSEKDGIGLLAKLEFFKYQSALFFITIKISNKYAETKREDVPAYCIWKELKSNVKPNTLNQSKKAIEKGKKYL